VRRAGEDAADHSAAASPPSTRSFSLLEADPSTPFLRGQGKHDAHPEQNRGADHCDAEPHPLQEPTALE
jgi:hypothetical protein